MICYLIECKNDDGNLIGLYVGTDGNSLSMATIYSVATKFADRLSAERFKLWMHGKYPAINLANFEVTEHEEVDTSRE